MERHVYPQTFVSVNYYYKYPTKRGGLVQTSLSSHRNVTCFHLYIVEVLLILALNSFTHSKNENGINYSHVPTLFALKHPCIQMRQNRVLLRGNPLSSTWERAVQPPWELNLGTVYSSTQYKTWMILYRL